MTYKIYLWGVLGGLAISALLVYPLYFHLPTLLIPSWHVNHIQLSMLSIFISLLLLAVVGTLTANHNNAQKSLHKVAFGAISGTLSALIAYALLVAPASGWTLDKEA